MLIFPGSQIALGTFLDHLAQWSPLARQYFDSKGSEFLLRDSVTEYMTALEGFYDWFFDAYTDEHRDAFTDLQRLSDEYDGMMPDAAN